MIWDREMARLGVSAGWGCGFEVWWIVEVHLFTLTWAGER